MAVIGLRQQIAFLEERGDLIRIKKEVDPRFELSAVSKKMEEGPALLFENVKNYQMPVVVNTDNTRDKIAEALSTTVFDFASHFGNAIENSLPPVEVDSGPVKEVIRKEDFDLIRNYPVPTHYEKDAGPYITSGLIVAEDPQNAVRNVSYHRMQVVGPDEIRLLIQPRHLYQMWQHKEKKGEPLAVAVVIGSDIAIRLAGATWGSQIPLELDEFAIAGALRGKPYELCHCETVDVWVPADSEIVMEGEILPNIKRSEGPFAEFTGTYGEIWENPVLRVKAITERHDRIFQDLLTFSPEHHLLLGLPYEPNVLKAVKASVPGTKAVNITHAGCGKFHAVIAIDKQNEGDGKDAIIAGLYSVRDIKLVTVVDTDVDPFNPTDVEWAISTRFQADRDLVVISNAKGNELDPSCPKIAVTAKMGIDATKPLDRVERFEKCRVPGLEDLNLGDYLK